MKNKSEKNRFAWNDHPDYKIEIERCKQPVQIVYNGETIADSRHALLVQEQEHAPVYYFPQQDVRIELLSPTKKITFCPYKGDANHWAITVKDQHLEAAAWCYENPFEQVNIIKNYIAFYPDVID